jgi:hypothetical protein|eukprot:COSAG03_NODE_381_length_8359_cov_16.596126_1_plen_210_part_00
MTGMIFTQELLTSSLYAQLAQHFTATKGWRWTNRAAALGCCGLAVVCGLLVWHTPEEVGLAPDGRPAARPASSSVYEEEAIDTPVDGEQREQEALLKGGGDERRAERETHTQRETETERHTDPTAQQGEQTQARGRSDYTVQQARRHIGLWLLALNIGCFGFCWAATDFYLLAIVAANTGLCLSLSLCVSLCLCLSLSLCVSHCLCRIH